MAHLDVKLALACLLAIASYAYMGHTYFFEIDLIVAWHGYSVVDFANSVLYPENFVDDYPGGAAFIGNSALVWIYPFVSKISGLTPFALMMGMIAIEVVLLIGGTYLLLRTLVPQTPAASYVLIALIFLASAGRQIDLARFGSVFLIGQFYVFADVLRIAALCAFLTKRYTACAVLLMTGFTIHPTMTVLTLPVLFAFLLASGRELRRLKPWISAGVFLIFAVAWFTFFVSQQAPPTAGQIPLEDYFSHSRLFNYHWYLSDLRVVLPYPDSILLPFMALVLAGLEALRRTVELGPQRQRQILAAIGLVVLLSAFGLVASEGQWSTSLLKALPQRISSFCGILLIPLIVHRIFQDTKNGHYGYALMGGTLVTTAFLQPHPYSIALAFVYAAPAAIAWVRRRKIFSIESAVCLAALPPILLLWAHWNAGYRLPNSSYFGNPWLFSIAVLGCVLVALQALFPSLRQRLSATLFIPASFALVGLFMAAAYSWITPLYTISDGKRTQASDYKDVQIWARDNTDTTALFITDPCIAYGWRDFSQRSSWGTFQEFYKNGWLYTGSLINFEEGLARGKRIGIDSRKMLAEDPSSIRQNSANVCNIARGVYYSDDPVWMANMIIDYGVDYFIYMKEHTSSGPRYLPVFENDTFYVLKATDLPAT